MAAGTPLDRRRPLALARSPRRARWRRSTGARRQRGARLLGAEAGVPRPPRARAGRRALRPPRRATTTRSPRGSPRAQHRYMPRVAAREPVRDARGARRMRSSSTSATPIADAGRDDPRRARPARRSGMRRRARRLQAGDAGGPSRPRLRASSWAPSTRRSSARRRCSFRRSPTLEQAARGEYDGIGYGLHGLPTVTDLQDAVAAIEGGHARARGAVGLTATTLPLLALLQARAITCSSPMRSTGRRGASATTT